MFLRSFVRAQQKSARFYSKPKNIIETPLSELSTLPKVPHESQTPETLHELHTRALGLQEELAAVQNKIRYYQDDSKKRILLLGAGLSSGSCLRYLLQQAEKESPNWIIAVGDQNLEAAKAKVNGHPLGIPFQFDVHNAEQRAKEVRDADIIISLLPASFHPLIAKEALEYRKDLITASYVSPEMKALHKEAVDRGVLFLNEMGLDPGIDHMSCMKTINEIVSNDGTLQAIESFCGGLVAPESDTNPWGYKISWNPRNVVLSGQGGCKFIQMGQYKYIPYHRLFSRAEIIRLQDNDGTRLEFEGYANRDSLKYREVYNLEHIPTFFRGTLRKVGFCAAWDIFVQLGLTDDSYVIEDSEHMTYRQFINGALLYRKSDSVELKVCYHLGLSIDSPEMFKLKWLGIFEDTKIGLKRATPAQILQSLIERKWKMRQEDKDMIVMYNKFIYNDNLGHPIKHVSTMVVKGDNRDNTAMGKTVGFPLAIAAKLILKGQIKMVGVQVPIVKDIYEPVLAELETLGITFNHEKTPYNVDYE